MYPAKIRTVKETAAGTILEVLLPFQSKTDEINRLKEGKEYLNGSIYFDDGRLISSRQQRAIFAIIKDISEWWADDAEYTRKHFQEAFCAAYDIEPFSISHAKNTCASVSLARNFITFLLEQCLKEGIPLKESGLNLTDDIEQYLHLCLKYKKCCICGKDADMHHWDAIGAGRDRRTVNDDDLRKIALCREHHGEAHVIGTETFKEKYHVKGIKYIQKEPDEVSGGTVLGTNAV